MVDHENNQKRWQTEALANRSIGKPKRWQWGTPQRMVDQRAPNNEPYQAPAVRVRNEPTKH
jgi:hypothetical protein